MSSPTPGEFRRTQNWIRPPGVNSKEAPYVPPPVRQMHEALHALEEYLHSDAVYPPPVRLAMIYDQFEVLYPFIDGNGRLGPFREVGRAVRMIRRFGRAITPADGAADATAAPSGVGV